MNTNNFFLFTLPNHNDKRGMMCVGECGKELPFTISRIFYDYNNEVSSEHRGNHANKNSEFVFICLHGKCTIKVNDGFSEEIFVMDDPKKALYTNKMVWKEMYDYSSDSVLLVLSNCKYDPNEYIRDFNEFLKIKRGA